MKRISLALALICAAGAASAQTYTINGMIPDYGTQQYLWAMGLPPGHYWLAPDGSMRPVSNPYGAVPTPNGYVTPNGTAHIFSGGPVMGGSGQINPDGSGGYYNPNTGAGYGTDGQGCYYVGDWSNC